MAAFFRMSWVGFDDRFGSLDDVDNESTSGLQGDGGASVFPGEGRASGLQNDCGDGLGLKKILVIGGVMILVVGGVCKVISMMGGSKDDPGNGLCLQDDSDDGFGLHVQDEYYNGNEFGLQDDSNDLSGLSENFDHGCGLRDETFGSDSGSIVKMEAEEVEAPSVSLQLNRAKRIKQYRSTQKILLVGEGNFSFSACLAKAFGSATNMVATSLDSNDFILKHYGSGGLSNLLSLKEKGCKLIHGMDATTMANHVEIGSMTFDIIVFNFPHAGFKRSESELNELKRHRNLVRRFFENAKTMLSNGGGIHVTHKTNALFKEWKIEELAAQCGLHLIEKTAFKLSHYPGYETKYGFGGNKNFNCYPSVTYKFGLSSS